MFAGGERIKVTRREASDGQLSAKSLSITKNISQDDKIIQPEALALRRFAAIERIRGDSAKTRKKSGNADTTGKPPAMPMTAKPGPKPYREVVTTKARTEKGLFLVHKIEDRYLFEIPAAMLNRDFLFMTRVAKAGADLRSAGSMSGYAGDAVNPNVISFQKGPNNKLFLLKKSFSEFSADSTRELFTAVTRSNMQPIAASFDIKAADTDSNGVVIDLTDYISGDNDVLHFDPDEKKA